MLQSIHPQDRGWRSLRSRESESQTLVACACEDTGIVKSNFHKICSAVRSVTRFWSIMNIHAVAPSHILESFFTEYMDKRHTTSQGTSRIKGTSKTATADCVGTAQTMHGDCLGDDGERIMVGCEIPRCCIQYVCMSSRFITCIHDEHYHSAQRVRVEGRFRAGFFRMCFLRVYAWDAGRRWI